jgi:methylated-DNA-[protein]-cysteine S-methyltransferase
MNRTELRTMVSLADATSRARLADALVRESAARDGLVDVAVATVDSPVGELFVAVTSRGLACVGFDDRDRATLEDRVADGLSPRVLSSARATDDVRRQLDEYFGGARRRFEVGIDHRLMSPFVRRVMAETAKVPFGEVSTYGAVARGIRHPEAARAVGAALGQNPIPIVLPCHRIIGASGNLTGYAGGLHRKEFLLRLEGDPMLFVGS